MFISHFCLIFFLIFRISVSLEIDEVVSDGISVSDFLSSLSDLATPIDTYNELFESLNVSVSSNYDEVNQQIVSEIVDIYEEKFGVLFESLREFHQEMCYLLSSIVDEGKSSTLPQDITDLLTSSISSFSNDDLLEDYDSNIKYYASDGAIEVSEHYISSFSTNSELSDEIFDDLVARMMVSSSELDEEHTFGNSWDGFQTRMAELGGVADSPLSYIRLVSNAGTEYSYPARFYTDPSIQTPDISTRLSRDPRLDQYFTRSITFGLQRGIVLILDLSMDEATRRIMNSPLQKYILADYATLVISTLQTFSNDDYISIL
ncbi:hypothetical protein ADUPG1_008024, partial [Aduncisulcus paluster]